MITIKNIGLVALCAAATAFAQAKPSQPSQQNQVQPPKDAKALLESLHQANLDEIQLAQMAETRAMSQQTKQVARQIITDHQQLDQQVTQLAKQMNVTLGKPTTTGKFEKQVKTIVKSFKDSFQDAPSQLVDTLYLSDVVVEHGNDLQMLQAAQTKFQGNPQVTQLLSSAIPVISRHLQMAAQALPQAVQQSQAVGGAGTQGTSQEESRPPRY